MTQLSRPFQIALAAMGLFVAVWFVALHGHSSSTAASGPAGATRASSATASSTPAASSAGSSAGSSAAGSSSAASSPAAAASPGAPSKVYHGSAPGIEGLTRDIAKARGAVAESEKNAKRLEEKSSQASSLTSAGATAGTTHATTPQAAKTQAAAQSTAKHAGAASSASTAAARALAARQALLVQEVKQGDTVVLLFWNPQGADDVAVHRELQLLAMAHRSSQPIGKVGAVKHALKLSGLELGRRVVVQEAPPSQVAAFGSVTHSVQVSGTPTILIINGHRQVTALTGFTDAFAIEQAIEEARQS